MQRLKFSIIIPTLNEEKDIAETIDAVLCIDYPDKEILIVDDSSDNTSEIVRRYFDLGVLLIRPGGGGRCEARNKGIMKATGDIVCLLNADVRPRPDFLSRLLVHYENGADYVLVGSHVSNEDSLFPRYIDSVGKQRYKNFDEMYWTEGFSCRRETAIKAGLFPVGFAVPICAGEDGYFGLGLRNSGAKKIVDMSIVVDHIAPASFKNYWYIRKGRGAGSAQIHRFIDKWSYPRILTWNMLKVIRTMAYLTSLIPALSICWRAAKHSTHGLADLLPFLYAWTIEKIAFHVGEWQMTFKIMAKEKDNASKG